jgi:hypothetical protein
LDARIRGRIDEQLKIRGLPIECHHMSWRDGGLSYPSLVDRSQILTVRSFGQMMLSKDMNIRQVMEVFSEEEREYRKIAADMEGTSDFLNWSNEKGESGTTSLVARTRKTVKEMGIRLKIEDSKLQMGRTGLEFTTSKPTQIGRFLTQKVVRTRLSQKVLEHELHGASYHTLRGNEVSNRFLTDIYTRKSNAMFRFAVTARADSLPTPANIQRWFKGPETSCSRCHEECKATLAHILNKCKVNSVLFTKRHNRIVEIIRKAIIQYNGDELENNIMENTPVMVEGLPEEVRRQRPDLTIFRKEGDRERIDLIEVICPYGRISHERNTMEYSFGHKMNKYQRLGNELHERTGAEVRVIPLVLYQ